jgi:hypothetical protein
MSKRRGANRNAGQHPDKEYRTDGVPVTVSLLLWLVRTIIFFPSASRAIRFFAEASWQ